MTKRKVFYVSMVGSGLFVVLVLALLYDYCGAFDDICRRAYGSVIYLFSSFIPVFLLSLITYKMKEEVFRAWWNFARWFVPIIIAVTYLLNNAPTGNSLNAKQDATFFFLFILYTIHIITSLTKIFRTYRKTKA